MSRAFLFGFLLIPMYAACSSDDFDNPSPNGGKTDAGNDSSAETGTGGSAGSEAEAGPVKWPVHVEVVNSDTQGTTVNVLSSMPDGTVDTLTPLDASGKMDVQVVDGGSVHLLVKESKLQGGVVNVDRAVYSYYAITKESSVNRVLDPDVQPTTIGDVTFHPDGTFPGGTSYVRVWPACSINQANSGNPYAGIPFPSLQSCDDATEYWAAAIAFNAAGNAISAQLLEHLPVASSPTNIYVSFDTPASYVTKKTSFTPLPADAMTVGVSVAPANPTGTAYGDEHYTVLFSKGTSVATANGSISLPVVTKNIAEFVVTDSVGWKDVDDLQRLTRRSQLVTTLTDTVWDPSGPARFETLSELDVTDVARPSISFALEATGQVGECIEASSGWLVDGVWTHWQGRGLPVPSGEVQFPELPTEVAEFALEAGAIVDATFATHYSPTTGDCLVYDENQLSFATLAQKGFQ